MSSSIAALSAQQLRHAADIKDRIESLHHELKRILGVSNSASAAAAAKNRRKMSAAGRARIVAAQKARWAKIKGEPASSKPVGLAKRMEKLARGIKRMKTQRLRLEREAREKIKSASK
jgi:hypothetical protein